MSFKARFKLIAYKIIGVIYRLFWLFPIRQNKVILNCYGGKGFLDNPKALALEINRRLPSTKIYLVINDKKANVPPFIKKIKRHTISEFYHYATAKLWIDNSRISLYLTKRKKQFYIETWHGSIGFKKTGLTTNNQKHDLGYLNVVHDVKATDLMLSNSTFSDDLYANCHGYKGEILKCGSPRLDSLFAIDSKEVEGLKASYGLSVDAKIVLYAPTFRDDGSMKSYDLDLKRLVKHFGQDWVLIIKLHPKMLDKYSYFPQGENVIYAKVDQDIYELLKASEVLITDFSSTAFEFCLLNRPVFLYINSLTYYQNARGLLFDLADLPFPYAQTQSELEAKISEFNLSDYVNRVSDFKNKYEVVEFGTAAKQTVDLLLDRKVLIAND